MIKESTKSHLKTKNSATNYNPKNSSLNYSKDNYALIKSKKKCTRSKRILNSSRISYDKSDMINRYIELFKAEQSMNLQKDISEQANHIAFNTEHLYKSGSRTFFQMIQAKKEAAVEKIVYLKDEGYYKRMKDQLKNEKINTDIPEEIFIKLSSAITNNETHKQAEELFFLAQKNLNKNTNDYWNINIIYDKMHKALVMETKFFR
jgi:hypothetical protein